MRTYLIMILLGISIFALAQNPSVSNAIDYIPANRLTELPGMNMLSIIASINRIEEFNQGFDLTDLSSDNQVVLFPQGWSGVSSFINPDDPQITTLFAPLMDELVVLYNLNGIYYPSQNINTLGTWDPQEGYIAKFTQETNLEFKGQINQNRTLSLSVGWNLIPVFSLCPVDVYTFFQNSGVVVVKDVASWKLFWPDMGINNLFTLSPGKAYFVLMSSPAELTFPDCTTQDWECGDPFTDNRDGQEYPTVQIGPQCWMAKNLNFGSRINGNVTQTNNNIIEKYCYNNSESNCAAYGGLYQWDEMMKYSENPGDQGLCPEGWYIPPDQEWTIMTDLYGGLSTAGGALKETGTNHWSSPNTAATNVSGFTGLPGGVRGTDGSFSNLSYFANFWTSTPADAATSNRRSLTYNQAQISSNSLDQNLGLSVRCRKRENLTVTPESHSANYKAGSVTFNISSSTSWTVQENASWFTVEPMSGNQNGVLTLNYEANTMSEPRSGEITITAAGGAPVVTITITQDAFIWVCGDTVVDSRDGSIYNTVKIGDQCWMAQNLNVGIMLNEFDNQTNNDLIEKYCFENEGSNCELYGALYQWDEMMQYSNGVWVKGICPDGWHVPEFSEFDILCATLGGYNDAGGIMKSTGTVEAGNGLWYSPNTGATNNSGFTALPSGYRVNTGGIYDIGYFTLYWSSDYNSAFPWSFALAYDTDEIISFALDRLYGFPIRCLKNESSHSYMQVTPGSTNLPSTTGTFVFTIESNTDWNITDDIPWLSSAPLSGSGNGQITVTYESNLTPALREAVLHCQTGTRSFEVSLTQAGIVPELTVSPTNKYIPHEGDTVAFTITSNSLWTIENSNNWFVISPENGCLNGTITLICNPNEFPEKRIGQFTVATGGGTVVVTISIIQLGDIPWACGDSIIDFRDSRLYGTVQIGGQCWMGQNLNIGTRIDGVQNQVNNLIIEKYCYDNLESNCNVYGGLYQWDEMMQYTTTPSVRGICPNGWHVPTDGEWVFLTSYLGGENVAGGKMKETGTTHWNSPNTGATNSSGFTALPGGVWNIGSFISIGNYSYWWSSMQKNISGSYGLFLSYNGSNSIRDYYNKEGGFTVRCIKDLPQLEVTPTSQNVTSQAGTATFSVTSNTAWTVSESIDWLTISPTNGYNNGIFTVIYDENNSFDTRNEYFTVTALGGEPIVDINFIQFGVQPILTVTPDIQYVSYQAGTTEFSVFSNGDWVVDQSNDWISVTPTEGSNNGIISVTFNSNPEAFERSGSVAIWIEGGYPLINITINQDGNPSSLIVTPISKTVDSPPGITNFSISSNTSWAVTESISWLSVSPLNGNNNGTLTVNYEANTSTSERTGYITMTTLGGATVVAFSVTQLAFFNCGDVLIDTRDMKSYNTVQIGTQCWMAKNLNVGTQINYSTSQTNNGIIEKHCYNNLYSNCQTFGGLYQWDEMMQYNTDPGVLGICINGWHIPTASEWLTLDNYVNSQNAYRCSNASTYIAKSLASNTLWKNSTNLCATGNNQSSNNTTGFSGMPGQFAGTGQSGTWWSSSLYGEFGAWYLELSYDKASKVWEYDEKSIGRSIRCLKDAPQIQVTPTSQNVTSQAGTTNFTIASNTSWFVAESVPWLTVTPMNGNNNGMITVTYNENSSISGRSGHMTLTSSEGTPVVDIIVNQAGVPAELTVTPISQNVTAPAGSTAFSLSSNTSWSVVESTSWLSVIPMNGSNNGTLTVTYEENTSIYYRSGQIIITASGGSPIVNVIVNQAGLEPLLSVTPDSQIVTALSGSTTYYVSSNTDWIISETVPWLTVSPSYGIQDGYFEVMYDENTTAFTREGEISIATVGGETIVLVTLTQIGWCGNNITDNRDGKTYPTVLIGTQCWMAQNLNVGTRINGTSNQTNNGTIQKYCYNNSESQCTVYGGLYQWNEMMSYSSTPGVQGICMTGWHVPTDAEWTTLTSYLGGEVIAGGKMKEAGTVHWASPNTGATNESGFNAFPGGCRNSVGSFSDMATWGYWWSSSLYDSQDAWGRALSYSSTIVGRDKIGKIYGFSVRCLKDVPQLEVTPANQNVTSQSGTTMFSIFSNESWIISENDDWFTVSPNAGNGNGTITIYFEENIYVNSRTGQISISTSGGNTSVIVTINQSGSPDPFNCGQDITDFRDGQVYPTVLIGEQCWMASNLNIGTRIDGINDPQNNQVIEKYCYNNDVANCDVYGGLYPWDELMNYFTNPSIQGICIIGWHVPTIDEWNTLTNYLSGQSIFWCNNNSTYISKPMASTSGWNASTETCAVGNNQASNNTTGFTGLPGGVISGGGSFNYQTYLGSWWSSSQINSNAAFSRGLYYSDPTLAFGDGALKPAGCSVRCLKD